MHVHAHKDSSLWHCPVAQTGALANDNHRESWKYTSETSRTDRGHQRKFSIFVLPLLFPREGRPPALKLAWGATLTLQEWRVGSCPAAPRSWAGLLLWDDMLLYIPIWTRLLWNVRKCVVSGRHHQCPLLPATARSQTLFCVCILFEFDVVHKVRHYIHSAAPVESTQGSANLKKSQIHSNMTPKIYPAWTFPANHLSEWIWAHEQNVYTVPEEHFKGILSITTSQIGSVIAIRSQLVENALGLVTWRKNYMALDRNFLPGVRIMCEQPITQWQNSPPYPQ